MKKFRLIEQFRGEIEKSEYKGDLPKLAAKAKVDRGNLTAFIEGRRSGMSLQTFSRICEVLKLELHKPEQNTTS